MKIRENTAKAFRIASDTGSTGYLRGLSEFFVGDMNKAAQVRGESGDDTLTFVVRDYGAAHVFAKMIGDHFVDGDGFDYGRRTANVSAFGIDVDDVVV